VSVRDESCLSCHKDTLHHAPPDRLRASSPDVSPFERGLMRISTMFARPPERCASCHVEHSGKDALVSDAQEGCTSCHADMSDRLSDTPLGDVSDFGRNHPQFHPTLVKEPSLTDPVLTTEWDVTLLDQARAKREELIGRADPGACDGFEIGGANFRGVAQLAQRPGGVPAEAQPGDNSGVVFPHAVHLDKDGCVAGLAARLGPKSGYDGPLTCANCHRPDGGGVLFEPSNMEKDCAACHSLAFETVNGFTRTLRHGQPEEVIASMLDFYKASIVNRTYAPPAQLEQRKRPGDANQNRYSTLRSMTFATAGTRAEERVRAIFSKGGACFGCHEVKEPTMPGGIDYQITPVKLLDQFMPRGAFDHAAHSTSKLNCAQCHKAETSQTSADVLAPGVEICQECHKGQDAFAAVPSTCTMCHGFHSENPDMPTMKGAHRQRDASQRRVWAPDRAATETMLHAHAP
jgi:cytochrome c551/c552